VAATKIFVFNTGASGRRGQDSHVGMLVVRVERGASVRGWGRRLDGGGVPRSIRLSGEGPDLALVDVYSLVGACLDVSAPDVQRSRRSEGVSPRAPGP